MSGRLRVALAQANLLVGDIEGNAGRIIALAEQARDRRGADVVVFPELALTGYPPEDLLLRPGLRERCRHALEGIRRRVRGIAVVVGHPQDRHGSLYNAASVLFDGERRQTALKQHLPNYSVFDERRYFEPGPARPCVAEIKGVRLGINICEDVWMPGPVRDNRAAGAEIILNLNASPYHTGKAGEREGVVSARVAESGLPVVYVNLVGGQDELVFDGGSFVMNADDEVVLRAPLFEEGLYCCDFVGDDQGRWRALAGGPLASLPDETAEIYQALVLGVRDYIDKNGFRGVVIGLSGGIDSALTLAIAVDAIGADRVEAVAMPSRYTADMSIEDARLEAEALGVEFRVIPIEPVFEGFLGLLRDEFAGLPVDTTEENIQARCRGVLLMAISNKKRKIVLTTGNKSEMAVGYATLYGDMAGGFAAIKDVPKTLVYRLARYRNGLSHVIPERVLTRPPSAELAPDQKDADSLPPYEILDPVLEMYVERDLCVDDIVAEGYDRETVRRVARMVDRNEYKRRQAPPGVRITRRAFGRDRRYPITSGYNRDVTVGRQPGELATTDNEND